MSTQARPYLASQSTAARLIKMQDDSARKDLRTEIEDLIAHLERDPALLLHRRLFTLLHSLDGRGLNHLADGVEGLGPWFRSVVADAETVTALVMDDEERRCSQDTEPHDPN